MKLLFILAVSGFLNLVPAGLHQAEPPTDNPVTQVKSKKNDYKVQIALLLDTSNSMDGLINQAKAQLWDLVNEFTYVRCGQQIRPRLEIALYQYGNNDLPSSEGYIQQVLGFSSDLDEISRKLFSLTTNGGEEFCGEVIHTSLRQLDWGSNPDYLRLIFIAGNEPFTQGKLDYRDAVTQAKEQDIVVNTIFCGNYDQGVQTDWQKGALMTGGDYMAIDHNRQVVHIHTPYDEIILKLNNRLNKTYISYGHAGAARMAEQSAQDNNAMELEEAVAVKRAVSKSSAYYANSSWDLVDASETDDFDIGKIDREYLPSELRSKSDSQLKSLISEKKAERQKIQKEIQELNKKRQQFIDEKNREEKGELESAMLQAIKRQASRKNYSWIK